jgi:hypothetical protein
LIGIITVGLDTVSVLTNRMHYAVKPHNGAGGKRENGAGIIIYDCHLADGREGGSLYIMCKFNANV